MKIIIPKELGSGFIGNPTCAMGVLALAVGIPTDHAGITSVRHWVSENLGLTFLEATHWYNATAINQDSQMTMLCRRQYAKKRLSELNNVTVLLEEECVSPTE